MNIEKFWGVLRNSDNVEVFTFPEDEYCKTCDGSDCYACSHGVITKKILYNGEVYKMPLIYAKYKVLRVSPKDKRSISIEVKEV